MILLYLAVAVAIAIAVIGEFHRNRRDRELERHFWPTLWRRVVEAHARHPNSHQPEPRH